MGEFGPLDPDDLTSGREAFRRRQWAAAFKGLTLADEAKPLQAEDLA